MTKMRKTFKYLKVSLKVNRFDVGGEGEDGRQDIRFVISGQRGESAFEHRVQLKTHTKPIKIFIKILIFETYNMA